MAKESDTASTGRALDDIHALVDWVRSSLFAVRASGQRATATTAVAAAAASEAYRVIDGQQQWQNATSDEWRVYLDAVWAFLGGDVSQHHTLSKAVADFLLSPLNHNEGQDGPDDFDRPQTVASYSAVLSAITWGVGFAETAVAQIFECIDLKFEQDDSEERAAEVQREIAFVRRIVSTVVGSLSARSSRLEAEVIEAIMH